VVELRAEAWVDGQTVLLGEIAQLEGDSELTAALAAVNVGTAPLAGTSRRLTVGQIEVRLRQAGINPRDLEFAGADAVVIYRGAAQPVVEEAEGHPVVVAARDIARLQIISADDLEISYQARAGISGSSSNPADFVGKRATRNFPAGVALTLAGVETPPLIERGAAVTLVSEVGGVRATAPGIARAAGGLGEVIPVENVVSRQVVFGEIIDAETVRVTEGGAVR